jgi:hypothetical protein
MQLHVEIEGEPGPLAIPGDGADLVALMSFAVVRGFGAEHPLIALAERFHIEHHLRLGPLTTFYEGTIEDAEDREKLELAWQPAASLLETLDGMSDVLRTDDHCRTLIDHAGTPGLPGQVRALADGIRQAASAGRQIRLSYTL